MSKKYLLNKKTKSVKYIYSRCKHMAKVIDLVGPITYELYTDSYFYLVRTILDQMLSAKASAKICQRLIDLCNGHITPVAINNLTDAQIKSIGTSNSKVKYIRDLTEKVMDKKLNFNQLKQMTDEEVIKIITTVRGLGIWSAKMYLIFVLNRENVLPYEDIAFLQGYAWCYNTNKLDKLSITKKFKKFSPYQSIAARYLYKVLDDGYVKKLNKGNNMSKNHSKQINRII